MSAYNREHDEATNKIRSNPRVLRDHGVDMEGVVLSAKEMVLWENDRFKREPDNVLFLPNKDIVVVEVKTSKKERSHAMTQLEETRVDIQAYFPDYNVRSVYVYKNGKFQVEEV